MRESLPRLRSAIGLALGAALALACSDTTEPGPVVSSVAIAALPDTLGAGDTLTLRAEVRGPDGVPSDAAIEWRSLTPAVASVSGGGMLRALDSGTATVVLTALGRRRVADTVSVPVRRLPRSIQIGGLADTIWTRTNDTATAVVRDGLGNVLDLPVTWSVSDTTAADTKLGGGIVRASEGGDVWVRATARGRTDSVRVRVDYRPVATPVPFVAFAQLTQGDTRADRCGLTQAGAAWCAPRLSTTFTEVPGGQVFRDVQGSQSTMCGLAPDDRMFCWGTNHHRNFGLGDSTMTSSATPVLAAGGRRFSSISLGGHALVCGVGIADSIAYCWGHNDFGQTGRFPVSSSEPTPAPVPGLPRVRQVSAGFVEACAIAIDGATWCWGNGFTNASTPEQSLPKQVAAPGEYVEISANSGVECGRTTSGVVACFMGATGPHRAATNLPPLVSLTSTTNGWPSCGLTASGEAYCLRFADPASSTSSIVGVRVLRTLRFRRLSQGGNFLCGIATDDRLYC